MLDKTDDVSTATENWLAQFETALDGPGHDLLKTLFHPDSYWRDVLALSWNIQTLNGAKLIQNAVNTPPPKGGGFRLRLEAGLIDPSGRLVKPP